MSIQDEYTAYCLDEAGAFLMRQKKPPDYRIKAKAAKPINRNRAALQSLRALGARVEI